MPPTTHMLFYLGEEPCEELEQLGYEPDRFNDLYIYNRTRQGDERIVVDFDRSGFSVHTLDGFWPRYFLRGHDSPLRIQSWGDLPNLFSSVWVEDNKIVKQRSKIPEYVSGERTLNLEQAANRIAGCLAISLANSIRNQPNTPKLYTTGGLDTAVLEAVISASNLDVEIDRSLHGTRCDPRWSTRGAERRMLLPYHPDLKQIPPHRGSLVTGHWGGVAMGRWPGIVRTYAHLDGWDYDEELERHQGSYLYNFLKSPTHRATDKNLYPGTPATTDQEALDRATEILYHSHEVRNFDDTVLITPFRSQEIHQFVHQLKPELFRDNAFTSSLHMAVIEICDPSVFDTVDRIKFKSPFG